MPARAPRFDGTVSDLKDVKSMMDTAATQPSAAATCTCPEGFVIRLADGYTDATFARYLAKYVRKGHIQTKDAWKRTWEKAKLGNKARK